VKEPREGWSGRFFHSQNMTFAYYTVKAGAWIHKHSHPNDEVWNIIDGQLQITIAGETQMAGPGCAAVYSSKHCSLSQGADRRTSHRRRLSTP
jgi:mannose-6-phosphate isomerase-like protein (cupin superfamily)